MGTKKVTHYPINVFQTKILLSDQKGYGIALSVVSIDVQTLIFATYVQYNLM